MEQAATLRAQSRVYGRMAGCTADSTKCRLPMVPEPAWSLPEDWPPRAAAATLSAAATEPRAAHQPEVMSAAAVPHAELLGVVGLLGGVGVLLLLLALWPRRHRRSKAPTPSKPARHVPV